MLFDKYVDFIDVYAEILDEERKAIYRLMTEREETAILAQYIKDKGFQEGRREGRRIAEILTSNVQQATTDENHGIFHL
ncbi:hypothetical protein [Desulforhabdus amnigena]|uniref:Uncharacterized protein n=1 Tax=Desulforhabdus amnigena TaxID=40218 RepID=A0A9W6L9C3_9BACT|nr:hypothetical protein [Desulforhabdus amnigena]GLI36448.1 hypothetical protein DAMNIGENAA_38810 [Desulforhabdus amnigena]